MQTSEDVGPVPTSYAAVRLVCT